MEYKMMKPSKLRTIWPLIATGVTICGCGLVDEDYAGKPLAVLNGNLRQVDSSADVKDISLAIFWTCSSTSQFIVTQQGEFDFSECGKFTETAIVPVSDECDGKPFKGETQGRFEDFWDDLQELVRYESVFPIKYQMEITQLPPTKARADLSAQGGHGELAMGSVVAYIDDNDNGEFDFGTPGNIIDRGLAHSAYQDYIPEDGHIRKTYFIVYLDGTINLDNVRERYKDVAAQTPEGFSLWFKELNTETMEVNRTVKPIDTLMDLVAEPRVESCRHWCKEHTVYDLYVDTIEDDGSQLICVENESTLLYQIQGIHKPDPDTHCVYHSVTQLACLEDYEPDDIPEDWPCETP